MFCRGSKGRYVCVVEGPAEACRYVWQRTGRDGDSHPKWGVEIELGKREGCIGCSSKGKPKCPHPFINGIGAPLQAYFYILIEKINIK